MTKYELRIIVLWDIFTTGSRIFITGQTHVEPARFLIIYNIKLLALVKNLTAFAFIF